MFELIALLTLVGGVVVLMLALAAFGLLLKLTFKILLLPFWILGVVLKGLVYVGVALVVLVVAPVLLGLALLLLPLVAIIGLLGAGVWIVT